MQRKEKVALFILFLILSFLLGAVFFTVPYSADSYTIRARGYEFYNEYAFRNMRPLQVYISELFFSILGKDIAYEILYRIYLIISLILLAGIMYMLMRYVLQILEEKNRKVGKLQKISIALCIVMMVFNPYFSTNLLYMENLTMILANFLSVVASILYAKNIRFKNSICLVLLTISEFCYQTMIVNFVIFSVIFYILKKERIPNFKFMRNITILFLIPMLLLFGYYLYLEHTGMEINTRFSKPYMLVSVVTFICLQMLIYFALYLIYYLLDSIIMKEYFKEKQSVSKSILFVIFVAIFYNFSFTLVNFGFASNRMMTGVGMLAGIILLIFAVCGTKWMEHKKRWISLLIITGVIEYAIFLGYYAIFLKYNQYIDENCSVVGEYIIDYNKTHDKKIENIVVYASDTVKRERWYSYVPYLHFQIYNVEDNLFDQLTIYLNGKEKLHEIEEEDETIYQTYFKGKEWTEFSADQFVVIGNTLHFCKY